MKKNLIVLQDGYKECGAASLLSIIRYYKGNISINKLVELTNTDKNGTNFYQLKKAAEKLGLQSIGYKIDKITSLSDLKKPFICQLVNQNYEHFVVVYEITSGKVIVMDPAFGKRKMTIEDFHNLWTGYILLFEPKKQLHIYKENKYLNKVIIEVLKKNKSIIFNILLLSLLFTIISCLYTLYFQIVLDHILDSSKNNLIIITFFFGILFILKCLTSFFRNELLIYLNQKIDCSLLICTFKKILLLPYSYYRNRTTGEMISRLNDLIYVKNILNQFILTVFLDGIILIASGIILWYMNTTMFFLLIIIILIYFLIFYIFRPILKEYTDLNQKNSAKLNSFLVETIGGFETIKNMSIERTMIKRMEELYGNSLNDSFIYDQMSNLEIFTKEMISTVGILLIEFVGFFLVMDHKLSLGSFMTYTFLANYFLEPVKNILNLNKEYFYALNAIKRVNHLFDISSEDNCTKTNFVPTGKIEFKNLSFSYNEETYILKNICFQIKKGKKVMILGSSGSGKSTILKLLLKYYPTKRDTIYLDDIDLNNYQIRDIRENISCISQNEILYTDTIKNNITLYQETEDQEWMKICKLIYVDDFVKKLFLGYDTKLEENGLNLSGGQRQRIILARLLLQKKEIIIIDEGLNAIDTNLERKILKNMFSYLENQTIIMVSHRVENMDLFDQVIQIKDGKVTDVSTKNQGELLYD